MRGYNHWTGDEQKHLVWACSKVLSDASAVPGVPPPPNWPRKLQVPIYENFRGSNTKQRTPGALAKQVYNLCKTYQQALAAMRENSCLPQLDREVFVALHKLHQDYPGSIVSRPQREKRSRQLWTVAEMECLARAMKACAGETSAAFEVAYYKKFLELGGKERPVNSVRAEANSMLLIHNCVLATLGSWEAWLEKSEYERENHSADLNAICKRAIRSMNRNIFEMLDDLAEAQRARDDKGDGTPTAGNGDQNASGTRDRAGVFVAGAQSMNQHVNPVNEQGGRHSAVVQPEPDLMAQGALEETEVHDPVEDRGGGRIDSDQHLAENPPSGASQDDPMTESTEEQEVGADQQSEGEVLDRAHPALSDERSRVLLRAMKQQLRFAEQMSSLSADAHLQYWKVFVDALLRDSRHTDMEATVLARFEECFSVLESTAGPKGFIGVINEKMKGMMAQFSAALAGSEENASSSN